jgi:hypothetical protein
MHMVHGMVACVYYHFPKSNQECRCCAEHTLESRTPLARAVGVAGLGVQPNKAPHCTLTLSRVGTLVYCTAKSHRLDVFVVQFRDLDFHTKTVM